MAAIDKFTDGTIVFLSRIMQKVGGAKQVRYLAYDPSSDAVLLKAEADSNSAWQVMAEPGKPGVFQLKAVAHDGLWFLHGADANIINLANFDSMNALWHPRGHQDGTTVALMCAPNDSSGKDGFGWLTGDPEDNTLGIATPKFSTGNSVASWTVSGPA